MEQFIVSARKYRPESFDSLIGQENIATTLKNSIIRGQLAHAYLFCGPRGVGKTTTARIFAKSINCLSPLPNMEPCGECESCISFAQGRSYSIHELDAASNNSVDDIRNLTDMVRIPPQVGRYSVYIIDEVHMLSSAAFNAFLKTLEEPPAHAIFILATTEKHKILPTILSRCQTYDFNRISVPDIVGNLSAIAGKEHIEIDQESLHVIAAKGDGSMRDSLTLFDQTVAFCGKEIKYEEVIKNLNVLDYEYYFKIVDNSLKGDYIASLLLFDEILAKGFNALYFISGLTSHIRDLIVSRSGAAQALLSLPDSLMERVREQSARTTIGFLYSSLNILTACEAGYRQSGNQRLHIEFALMKLAEKFIPAEESRSSGSRTASLSSPADRPATGSGVEPTDNPADQPSAAATPLKRESDTTDKATAPGFSLKAMMNKVANSSGNGEKSSSLTDEPLSEERIKEAWKWLAEREKEAGRKSLGATMLMREPVMDPADSTIRFEVSNIAQRDWIREKALVRMESDIRRYLKNSAVKIAVEVTDSSAEEPVEKKLYMPEEKARYMLANNEQLREFSKELNLEIK